MCGVYNISNVYDVRIYEDNLFSSFPFSKHFPEKREKKKRSVTPIYYVHRIAQNTINCDYIFQF